MHCYTVEDARLGATQTLTEVAEALVSNVDAPLRAYAATHPGKSEVVSVKATTVWSFTACAATGYRGWL